MLVTAQRKGTSVCIRGVQYNKSYLTSNKIHLIIFQLKIQFRIKYSYIPAGAMRCFGPNKFPPIYSFCQQFKPPTNCLLKPEKLLKVRSHLCVK